MPEGLLVYLVAFHVEFLCLETLVAIDRFVYLFSYVVVGSDVGS